MRDLGDYRESLSGSLLVSHPNMTKDPFKETVILMSAHSDEDGAFGVIINRPLGKCLGEIRDEYATGLLAKVPLYSGGPVGVEELILSAWKWDSESGTFKLFFGISPKNAESMLQDPEPGLEVRGFLGYAGWGRGQVENELKLNAWVVSPIDGDAIGECQAVDLWLRILWQIDPALVLRSSAPDDPSRN